MFPFEPGNVIRCECGHAVAQHTDTGCSGGPAACRCQKTPSAIVLDEIALLRPEWLEVQRPADLSGEARVPVESDVGSAPVLRKVV
jgi:hypothetical protein